MSHYKRDIRALLKKFPDGLTALELSQFMELGRSNNVSAALRDMGDAYIDRWVKKATGQWAPVWCVVDVPEHCPRPDYSDAHKRRLTRTLNDRTQSEQGRAHSSC